jgi:hypothetical protein
VASSAWERRWRRDLHRVLSCLSRSERDALRRWGLLSRVGREIFLGAAKRRLGLKTAYAAYVLERAPTAGNLLSTSLTSRGSQHVW